MLGTAAWKLGVDAYLYYATNGWQAYGQGVQWSPDDISPTMDMHYMRYDGQAQFVIPGPQSSRYSGFLATLQPVPILSRLTFTRTRQSARACEHCNVGRTV